MVEYSIHMNAIADKEDLRFTDYCQLADSIHDFDPLPTDKEFLYRIHRKRTCIYNGIKMTQVKFVGFLY
jgi:hypothetical protein